MNNSSYLLGALANIHYTAMYRRNAYGIEAGDGNVSM